MKLTIIDDWADIRSVILILRHLTFIIWSLLLAFNKLSVILVPRWSRVAHKFSFLAEILGGCKITFNIIRVLVDDRPRQMRQCFLSFFNPSLYSSSFTPLTLRCLLTFLNRMVVCAIWMVIYKYHWFKCLVVLGCLSSVRRRICWHCRHINLIVLLLWLIGIVVTRN